uniref:MGA conserved domain-containing protein n=1 Tax=Lygus hesperus TaxID=30085 RepID=A0A146KTU2_LYGHE
MLEVEWSGGEDFTEDLGEDSIADYRTSKRMFHGTIDLICSSDEDYDSELLKTEDATLTPPKSKEMQEKVAIIDPDVVGVVEDLVNFVERCQLIPEFGFDPEHEVKEEVFVKKEGTCGKPHCFKGCLCSSLGGRFPHGPTHCGKERCMFECACQERGLLTIDDESHYTDKSKRKKKLPTRFKDVVLGKAYEKLHARTIYEDFNGHDIHSESDDECHRMTQRMKAPSGGSSKNPSPELKKEVTTDFGCSMKKKYTPLMSFDKASIATVRKTIQERRVGFLSKTLDEEQTLADVQIWCTHHEKFSCLCINYVFFQKTIQERRVGFLSKTLDEEQTLADVQIWCTHHEKFSCLCINYVFFQKTNALIWRPSNASRYLANKVMYDIGLKMPTLAFHEVFPYNHNNHSARTQGPITNYTTRNKDEVFASKRKMEIEYNVLSYSNSYMKFYVRKYPCIKKNEPVPSAEPYDKSIDLDSGMGDVVHIIKTKEKLILDVGREKLNVKVNYVVDEEVDEDEIGDNGETTPEKGKSQRRKRKPTMKMIQLEEDRKREKELLEFEWAEKEALQKAATQKAASTPQVPQEKKKRRGRKPKSLLMMERRTSELSDRSTIREPTPEVDIIRCSGNSQTVAKDVDEAKERMKVKIEENATLIKEEPSSPDYFSAESRMDMEDAKEEAIVCAPDIGLMASCAPSKTTMTTHVTTAQSVTQSSSKSEKQRQDEEFREDIPKPFLGFSESNEIPEFEECDDPENDDPDSIHSKKVLVLKPRKDGFPHSGLMCLTPGLGYVTVLENLPGRIVISDPGVPDVRQTFDGLSSVNAWLNMYIRGKVAISPPDLVLQWILVKPGILKLKQVKPLDPGMFWNPNIVVTPTGIIQKKSLESSDASNYSVLRKQLSEHSVFSPLIRKQLAMKEAASALLKTFVSNPKFCSSNLVPNPKSLLRHLLKRQLPREEISVEVPPPKVPAMGDSSVSFETVDGCVTVHRLSSESTTSDVKNPAVSSATVFSQVKPPPLASSAGLPTLEAPRDLEIRHQVTIRPLPSLTKITPPYLTTKHTVKVHK